MIYMAHPCGQGATLVANVARAKRWLRWLIESSPPDVAYVAPWLHEAELVHAGAREAPDLEAVMARCLAVVGVCHGVVLVGGRISPGMAREALAAKEVRDLTHLGSFPPGEEPPA